MLEKMEECDDGKRTTMFYVPTRMRKSLKVNKSKEFVLNFKHE